MVKLSALFLTAFFTLAYLNHASGVEVAEIENLLVHSPSTVGRFAQEKKLSILTKPLISAGDFLIVKDLGVVWNVRSPVTSNLVITQDQVLMSDRAPSNAGRTTKYVAKVLMLILSGNLDAITDVFHIISVELKQDDQWTLELEPKTTILKKFLSGITLCGGRTIETVYLEESSGDSTRLILTEIEHFDPVPESMIERFSLRSDP